MVAFGLALAMAACSGESTGGTATTDPAPVGPTTPDTNSSVDGAGTSTSTTSMPEVGDPDASVEALIRQMDGFFAPFVLRPAIVGLDARTIAGDPTDLFDLVDPDRLEVDVRALSERRGADHPEGRARSADRMNNGLRDAGYLVETVALTSGDAFAVLLEGTECADRVLVVTAHYDAPAGSPGAHAATGPAGLLELARVLGEERLPMTVTLVALPVGAEGVDSAAEWVEHLDTQADVEPIAAYALDGLGLTTDETDHLVGLPGDYLLLVGERTSEYLARVTAVSTDRFLPGVSAFTAVAPLDLYPEFDDRDAAAWWEQGLQALLVTDTGAERDDRVGSPEDRPWRVDGALLADGVRAVLAGIVGVGTIDTDGQGPDVCRRAW